MESGSSAGVALGAVLLLSMAACGAPQSHVVTATEKTTATGSVNACIDAYQRAWLQRDARQLADCVALDQDAVHAGTDANEIVVGGKAFLDGLQKAVDSVDKTTRASFRDRRISFDRSGDVAWVWMLADYDFVVGGKPASFKGIRATCVFEKRDGRWLLVHSHASVGRTPDVGNMVDGTAK